MKKQGEYYTLFSTQAKRYISSENESIREDNYSEESSGEGGFPGFPGMPGGFKLPDGFKPPEGFRFPGGFRGRPGGMMPPFDDEED